MKKYKVKINCTGWDELIVEADNPEEAIEIAKNNFNCSLGTGEWNREKPELLKEGW